MTEKTKFREGERVIVVRDSSEVMDGAYQPGEETEITEVIAGAGLIYYKTPRGLIYGADDLKKVEEEVAVYKPGTMGSIMNNLKGHKKRGVNRAVEDEPMPTITAITNGASSKSTDNYGWDFEAMARAKERQDLAAPQLRFENSKKEALEMVDKLSKFKGVKHYVSMIKGLRRKIEETTFEDSEKYKDDAYDPMRKGAMKSDKNIGGPFGVVALKELKADEKFINFGTEKPEYEIDFDKVQTVEDIKNILKSAGITVNHADEHNEKYLKEM